MSNAINDIIGAQKGAINKSAIGVEKARQAYDERTKNDPDRRKVAAVKRANEKRGTAIADKMAKKAGIKPEIREKYTKKYR